jgi:ABC-type nitrate/sulfonate/bicarbonate transport system substrate-binding protein
LLILAVALAACGGGDDAASSEASADAPTPAPERAEVTLIMDWVPWVLDIPVDVAQEKGFYADHGLTVEQTLPAGPTDVVKFVATGKAQFGLYYAPDTLLGVAEDAPLLSVAAVMSHAPLGMAMAPGVQAVKPADLEGMVAGVVLIPSTRASFATMLESGGVSQNAVEVVDPGFDLVPPLLAGKYDSVSVTEFGELVQADAAGEQLDYLDFRDWGTPDYPFLNVLTERGFASENPATVRAFVAGTLAGLEYAVAHPEEAASIYVARHPELDEELLLAQWKAATPSLAVAAAGKPAGWQDATVWGELNDWMVESGQLDQRVDDAAAVSNADLPDP